jgi:hypothetical protein
VVFLGIAYVLTTSQISLGKTFMGAPKGYLGYLGITKRLPKLLKVLKKVT